ncbi:MAG: hypothetical protein EON59_07355 [Alphaproteobacteria bacterium]|nr:MAG: hypothetical protein EON59_07355 [Alphaproteobacteria bacterium]
MGKFGWKRPETARVVVLLNKKEIEEIDRLGMGSGLPSRSETVRQLIAKGLEAEANSTEVS